VKVTHSWGSGMIVIGAAAACGALLWLFVHPERPLLDDEAAGPRVPAETGATTEPAENAEARSD
jgi:MFS transporter, ACS family, glucarate transporter